MIRLLAVPGGPPSGSHNAWRGSVLKRPSEAFLSPIRTPPAAADAEIEFSGESLRAVRRLVACEADRARLPEPRREDLVLAVDELATNSVTHGGGHGKLSVWRREGTILCEVRDSGHIEDPLAGQRPPAPTQSTGRGLWVVGRLCDRVRICSKPGRTTVRVQMRT